MFEFKCGKVPLYKWFPLYQLCFAGYYVSTLNKLKPYYEYKLVYWKQGRTVQDDHEHIGRNDLSPLTQKPRDTFET